MPAFLNRRHLTRLALSLSVLAAALAAALPAEAGTHSLSGPLPETAATPYFSISPDSRTVVFVTDKDTDDVSELYAVPISGTNPIKLNPPLVAGGDVNAFSAAFTADSQYVLYLADQEVDNQVELYRVPVHGGAAVKLSAPLVAGGNVTAFRIDDAANRVLYTADEDTNETFELYSVPLTGGAVVKISGPMTTGGDVGEFDIDFHSGRAVYSADQDTDGMYELYSLPLNGGTPIKLNPTIILTGGGDSGIYGEWAIDPAEAKVVFIARQTGATGGRLYRVLTVGADLQQLSFSLLSTQRLLSFEISPTGNRVVFNVGTRDGATNALKGNLYSNLIDAGGAANITETADPLYGTNNYRVLSDGSGVVYAFQKNMTTTVKLEAASMTGVRTPLYVPGASDPPLYNFLLSPNSQWVAYQIGSTFLAHSMFTVPPSGGSASGFGSGDLALILPNSSRLVFRHLLDADSHSDLFSQQIFGGDQRNLSRLFPPGYITDVAASPDSHWLVFVVQIDGHYELRATDGANLQPPLFLPMVVR